MAADEGPGVLADRLVTEYFRLMKTLNIRLSPALYNELVVATCNSRVGGKEIVSVEDYAKQCVEAILATRRLNRLEQRLA